VTSPNTPTDPSPQSASAWELLGANLTRAASALGAGVWFAERGAQGWTCADGAREHPGVVSWPVTAPVAGWRSLLDDFWSKHLAAHGETSPDGAFVWLGAFGDGRQRTVLLVVRGAGPMAPAWLPLVESLVVEARRAAEGEAWSRTTQDIGLVCDAGLRIVAASPLANERLGAGRSLVGRRVGEVVPGWHLEKVEAGEIARGHHDGLKLGWTFQAMAPGADGGPRHWLRFRVPAAEKAQQVHQGAFLQALRHDVRSPLTALRGLVAVLIDEPAMPADERQQLLELLRVEAERIVNFVEDYLVAMRLRIEPRPQQQRACDMRAALLQYFAELEPHAAARRIHFENHMIDVLVEADPPLLDAFIRNAIGAVFRMADAGATIQVELLPDRLVIRGRGPGLFHQLLDRPFTSLARSTSSGKRTPGAALGLFLVKKIADAHGWRIELTHVDGVFGATVSWPARAPT
jgi:signal transduction histidine kinase